MIPEQEIKAQLDGLAKKGTGVSEGWTKPGCVRLSLCPSGDPFNSVLLLHVQDSTLSISLPCSFTLHNGFSDRFHYRRNGDSVSLPIGLASSAQPLVLMWEPRAEVS